MSFETVSTLICDGCGAKRVGAPEHRSTVAAQSLWEVRRKAIADGWLVVSRGRYNVDAHYCAGCADKPAKPIPKKRPTQSTPAEEAK